MEGGKDADCIIEVWGFQQQGFLGTDNRNCFPARFTELSVLGAGERRMHELYRFIDTQVQDASMNMAIDEAVHTKPYKTTLSNPVASLTAKHRSH